MRKPSYNRTYAVIIVMTIVKHAFAIAKLRERDNNKKKKKEMLCEYRIGKSSHKMNEKKKRRERTL